VIEACQKECAVSDDNDDDYHHHHDNSDDDDNCDDRTCRANKRQSVQYSTAQHSTSLTSVLLQATQQLAADVAARR